MKIVKINEKTKACSKTIIKKTEQCVRVKLTRRVLPNSIGSIDENYGAKWIVFQEQKERIKEFWDKIPQNLKDAIKNFD